MTIGQIRHNAMAAGPTGYPDELKDILGRADFEHAWADITSWPGYEPTPLHSLPGLADSLGVGQIWFKDEGGRFGLGAFKALGGAYAVGRRLKALLAEDHGLRDVSSADLLAGRHRDMTRQITMTCATAGSHGRSVAWGADMFGCRSVVHINEDVSVERADWIERLGAKVVRVPGTYEDAVRETDKRARANGWHVISDTAYPGYVDIPRHVMQGYRVAVEEIVRQLPDGTRPTHTVIQGGCGGLAASVCAHLWDTWGAQRPRFIIVEPQAADCLLQSAAAGRFALASGNLDTIMGGLCCAEPSLVAWDILSLGADDFVTISDDDARHAMGLLANGDPPIVAGESAGAGLGAIAAAASDRQAAAALGLDGGSRILFIGSEGASDPGAYRDIVGRSAEDVSAGR